jgi:nitroimidazol reductase NimA-like FMN-containing flavoprotein (pyridoxamine 5'-phosphate oxidase superfamily)
VTKKGKPTVRMTDDEIWSFVADAHTGILTTLRRDGTPITLPLWFCCVDRTIYVQSRGKKLDRIRHDPRASFLVEAGTRWVELKAVHLTGRAEIVDLDDPLSTRFRAELARKYAASRASGTEMPKASADVYRSAVRGIIRFTPDDRILQWDNAKLRG